MGSTNGVIHVLAPEGAPPPPAQRHLLGVVAAQAGASLGMHRAYATSQVRASTDALTGLLNRRSLDEIGSRLRRSEDQVGVVLGDLDHFKDLNDRHGHEAGDRALRLFAQVLRDTSRDGDVVGRWGGEEFLLLLPGATADIAAALAGRVRQALAATLASGVVPSFSASFGVSELSRYPSYEEALTAADRALYRAKRDGRDRVVVDEAGSGDSGAVPAG